MLETGRKKRWRYRTKIARRGTAAVETLERRMGDAERTEKHLREEVGRLETALEVATAAVRKSAVSKPSAGIMRNMDKAMLRLRARIRILGRRVG